MGDTPAPAISIEAIYMTANMFESDGPKAAKLLKRSSYVDDLILNQLNPRPWKLPVKKRTCLPREVSQLSVGNSVKSPALAPAVN